MDPEKAPLCTVKELLAFGLMCVVYASIIFSLDPEWVAWAAPLAFGGALSAADPPPASIHLGAPPHTLTMAFLCSLLSLFALALLTLVRDGQHLNWLSRAKAKLKNGSVVARALGLLTSRSTQIPGR